MKKKRKKRTRKKYNKTILRLKNKKIDRLNRDR